MTGRILQPNRTIWLAFAGLVIVGVGIGYLMKPVHRAGDATAEFALLTPRDGATLGSPSTRFRWQRHPETTAYRFSLFKVNRSLIWSALVRDTTLVIPASVQLQRGQTFLWSVEAILLEEATAHSELHAFTLSQ